MKEKCLIFYTYLPPWRIDIFNDLHKEFDLKVVFLNINSKGFRYNTTTLLDRLKSKVLIWNIGFSLFSYVFRIGIGYLIWRYKPRIVFTHEFSPTSVLLAFYRRVGILRFQLFITTSDNIKIIESHGKIKRIFRNFILNNCDGMVVYTSDVKQLYSGYFPQLSIDVCPNIQRPQTLLRLYNSSKTLNSVLLPKSFILFVGRLEMEKGIDLLFKAFINLPDSELNLVVVGKGSLRDTLSDDLRRKGIMDRVHFIPELYGSELFELYKKARFLVLPSRHEPFGAVVNEALVFGCPVLLSKYAGAKVFIKSGYNGFLFDPLDKSDFHIAINKALESFKVRGDNNLMIIEYDQAIKAFRNVVKQSAKRGSSKYSCWRS